MIIAEVSHPIPFRTRPLNPLAPMILRLKTRESRSSPAPLSSTIYPLHLITISSHFLLLSSSLLLGELFFIFTLSKYCHVTPLVHFLSLRLKIIFEYLFEITMFLGLRLVAFKGWFKCDRCIFKTKNLNLLILHDKNFSKNIKKKNIKKLIDLNHPLCYNLNQ